MKTPEERQMFFNVSMSMRSFWWTQLYLNLFQHLHNLFHLMRYTMRQTHVPPNIIRSTKLRGAQHSPELAFRSTDFCVPENLIFSALPSRLPKSQILTFFSKKFAKNQLRNIPQKTLFCLIS